MIIEQSSGVDQFLVVFSLKKTMTIEINILTKHQQWLFLCNNHDDDIHACDKIVTQPWEGPWRTVRLTFIAYFCKTTETVNWWAFAPPSMAQYYGHPHKCGAWKINCYPYAWHMPLCLTCNQDMFFFCYEWIWVKKFQVHTSQNLPRTFTNTL